MTSRWITRYIVEMRFPQSLNSWGIWCPVRGYSTREAAVTVAVSIRLSTPDAEYRIVARKYKNGET